MRGLPRATSILVWITALAYVIVAVVAWRDYTVYRDDLASWDPATVDTVDLIFFVPALTAAVVFVVWLWRARTEAEAINPLFPHRHDRGWVIAGWIVPFIFLWYPLQVVSDVVAGSRPQVEPGVPEQPQAERNLLSIWWGTWVATTVIDMFPVGPDEDPTANDFVWGAVTSTVTAVLSIVSAVYAVRVIRLITDLQASRPAGELAPDLPPYQH
ncbi:DUF4328 domain-containing protein [Kribbella sp. NPDC051718]|uniref:DUF4328 domain-containing protein n=1 Tax=Kribbella sp. NPDC051718 TaxID=3155168 RepID=UPI00343E87A0